MKPAPIGLTILMLLLLGSVLAVSPALSGQIVYPRQALPTVPDPALADSAIGAVVAANGGKTPATGEELTQALARLGKFVQLPVPFSAVRLDSGLANPRVVITESVTGLGDADVTRPNLSGRLFLAANMEQIPKGAEPRVTSVEFISWNAQRRRFDFGVIDRMGGDRPSELRIVDGGRCFACHKNRGPILGGAPWSNSTHDDILRLAEARGLTLTGSHLPATGPFAVQPLAGKRLRERIDGMALATPEAKEVDFGVRLGADLRLNRDTFRLMTRTAGGRKALVVLLTAVIAAGPLDPKDKSVKQALDDAFDKSFLLFAADWADLQKEAKPSMLIDADPAGLLVASGVRSNSLVALLGAASYRPTTSFVSAPSSRTVLVPGISGGGGSRWRAPPVSQSTPRTSTGTATTSRQSRQPSLVSPGDALSIGLAIKTASEKQVYDDLFATIGELNRYETARASGAHGLTSPVQPSNPKAFVKPPVKIPTRASSVLNATMLAATIGLTEGDRKFLSTTLADAAKRVNSPRVTAATLARAVFEGPTFSDVLGGEQLPDRDEFKDRFAEGLQALLKTQYPSTNGFSMIRADYASRPKYDPKAAAENEVAVVPTTACLRCHDIRPSGKAQAFEPIPALAFDPFDKRGREAWLKTADAKRKEAVLGRFQTRLFGDADMPPEDAPEYDRFRSNDAAAFDNLKDFLQAELEKVRRR